MAQNPLATFTNAFANGMAGARRRGNDQLEMMQLANQQRQWESQQPYREAQLEGQQLQNQAGQLQLENARRQQSREMAARTLARMQSDPEWAYSPDGQRQISAVFNHSPDYEDEGIEGFSTMSRDEARLAGMDDGIYSRVLANNHPEGRSDDPSDHMIVPLTRGESGDLVPFDLDDRGRVKTYSMKGLEGALQTIAGSPDAVSQQLGSLYTGQPGATVGGNARPSVSYASAPGQSSGGGRTAISPAAGQAAMQTAAAADRPQTEDLALDPQAASAGQAEQRVPFPKPTDDSDNSDVVTAPSLASYTKLFGNRGGRAAASVPAVEGESDETATGRPRDLLSKDALRATRRVAEGKGISAAQAKSLADDDTEKSKIAQTDPTPRAAVGAGQNMLSTVQANDQGSYSVRGGRRPSPKQLSSAALLNSMGMLSNDDLKRYADLGVVSEDGVNTIREGMAQATSRANNAASNATRIQMNNADNATRLQAQRMQNQAAMDRTRYQEAAQDRRTMAKFSAKQTANDQKPIDPVEQNETLQKTVENEMASNDFRESGGMTGALGRFLSHRILGGALGEGDALSPEDMSDDQKKQLSRQAAVEIAPALNAIPRSAQTPDETRKYSHAWLKLQDMISRSDNGMVGQAWRAATSHEPYSYGEDGAMSFDMSDDPLAISLIANNSPIITGDQGSLGRYNSEVREPMSTAMKEYGLSNLADDPATQRTIFRYATNRMAQDAARDGNAAWKDSDRLKQYIRQGVQRLANNR